MKLIDGLTLSKDIRELLRPGEIMFDRFGNEHELPRYFYEVPSHGAATSFNLTEHFTLAEFLLTDLREHERLEQYPRYIPAGVALLAFALEVFRYKVDSYIHIAANGGYRSPAHALSTYASQHCWATAANIFRIGETMLNDQSTIERYADLAKAACGGIRVRPYGHTIATSDDHLHIDIGRTLFEPDETGSNAAMKPSIKSVDEGGRR